MDFNEFLPSDCRENRRIKIDLFGNTNNKNKTDRSEQGRNSREKDNVIKINCNKLPGDFFSKSCLPRKIPTLKLSWKDELPSPLIRPRKVESERMHNSPEKTSVFGFFDPPSSIETSRRPAHSKIHSRKADTRNESKREPMFIPERRLTPVTNPLKNDMLELYPCTLDLKTSNIIVSYTKEEKNKITPRKDNIIKIRETMGVYLNDPESDFVSNLQISQKKPSKSLIHGSEQNNNMSLFEQDKDLNMTFCNVKSTCFPPISNKHL